MKLGFIIKILSLFFSITASAKTLDLIVNTPFLTPDNSKIYYTGDFPAFCKWRPDCLEMNYIANGSYRLTIDIPNEIEKINYKITRGNWENEAADSYSLPIQNLEILIGNKETSFVQNIIHWKDLSPLKKSLNVLGPYYLNSMQLGADKKISVYLPPSYNNSKKFYPVIYMHDGQNVFDPTTANFGVEWSIDETMNKLIANNEINEAIVVSIHTTDTDRQQEYDYFLKGKNYSDFIVNSAVPFTEKNFRAIKNRNSRFMMGSSMGALISLMMIIDRPDIFSKIAGLSFPAYIHDKAIFKFINNRDTIPLFDFYMDRGNWGLDASYERLNDELHTLLMSKGLGLEHYKYLIFPFAGHTEADWAQRAYIPLKYLLRK